MTSMNDNTIRASTPASSKRLTTIVMASFLALGSFAAFADDQPGIIPIQSHPYGQTYGQWAVRWWQWALSIPASSNPVADTSGEFAGVGQSGPVWFLAGTFGNSVERTVTIPAGKGIFLPIHNWIFGAIAGDCDPSNPGVPCDVPTLQAAAAAATESVQSLDVFIDGQPVPNVRDYRAASPGGFDVTLPEDAVLGLPTGTFGPHVADGYWLMLEPLPPGSHTVALHVTNPVFGLEYTVVHHLNVRAGKGSAFGIAD